MTGYTTGLSGTALNGAGGTFIDADPDRFMVRLTHLPGNANAAMAETMTIQAGTLTDTGAADDTDHNITLLETGPDTGVFESETQLLTAPDLSQVAAADQDDGFAAYSLRAGAAVADEADDDRTHKATIDGHVRVNYTALGGPCDLSVPVCDRVPSDERREVRTRVHVFNEPFDDVGYDHDADPATPDIGAGNGIFDFNDTNGNGVHDAGEPSEPWTDIRPDGAKNTVLGSIMNANNRVADEIERSNTAWAQACIRVAQAGSTNFEDAPTDAGGVNILRDGEFSAGPGADEEVVLMSATGTTHDTVEVYFVSRFDQASMAEGLASTPGLRGGITLPVGQQEDTYSFVASSADIRRRVLAHEFGHALTNQGDVTTPVYVFFRSFDASTLDDSVSQQRRITQQTQTNARTCRPAGNMSGIGNRLLSGCP